MDWITDRMAIGNYLEARTPTFLSSHAFRSVLSLDGTLTNLDPDDLTVEEILAVKLIDGPGNNLLSFRRAIEYLEDLVENHPPVMVHCHAGRSRSVIVVAGYFMQTEGIGPREALARVSSKREINITQGLEGLLLHL